MLYIIASCAPPSECDRGVTLLMRASISSESSPVASVSGAP